MSISRILLLVSLSFITSCASAENTVQKLYKSVNPAVVELHVKALADPKPGQATYKASVAGSLGSGALINKKGRILTAAHVVDKATHIEVVYADGTKTTGHVVWVESMIDLAMIQAVDVPNNIEPLKLAKSNDYDIGEQVVVIGAPYGVSHSLSVGYLSGIRDGKPIPATKITPRLLQTDASINVGNSGGPMFNGKGEIIGIVSHILSKSGGSNGMGFVVSIDTIHDIMDSDPGTFSGFIPFLLNKKQSDALNNAAGHGMLIQHVVPRTLAEKLGFKGGNISVTIGHTSILLGGDILLSINGNKITDIESAIKIKQRMADVKKGDQISFTFLRAGEVKTVYWKVESDRY
jgi:serine protease Do